VAQPVGALGLAGVLGLAEEGGAALPDPAPVGWSGAVTLTVLVTVGVAPEEPEDPQAAASRPVQATARAAISCRVTLDDVVTVSSFPVLRPLNRLR
jgi:hypothetical protein